MANERRVRTDFRSGFVSDDPLAFDATTFNSPELAALPEIDSSNHMAIVFDPFADADGPEIAYIIDHDVAATTASIVRAQEGTTAVEHPVDVVWTHGPTAADFGLVVDTEADLPDPGYFVGMRGLCLDTQRELTWNGVGWELPWAQPWGRLGHSRATTDVALNAGLGNTEATQLAIGPVDVPAGRRVRITAEVAWFSSADGTIFGRIRQGLTTSGTLIGNSRSSNVGGQRNTIMVTAEDTPAAGSRAWVLTTAGLFTSYDTRTPWAWYIEDIGPAANPS